MGDKDIMIVKESFEFEGRLSVFKGIPEGLYTEEELKKLALKNPGVNIGDYLSSEKPHNTKNVILDLGKKTALNMLFRQLDGPGVVSPSFSDMAIGDGGYDFGALSKKFPKPTDGALNSIVASPIAITSFQGVAGDTLSGFTKLIAATFFSVNYNHSDYSIQNQTDYYINEAGILDRNGNYFNKVSFNNFPFDPLDNIAMTINWEIRVK